MSISCFHVTAVCSKSSFNKATYRVQQGLPMLYNWHLSLHSANNTQWHYFPHRGGSQKSRTLKQPRLNSYSVYTIMRLHKFIHSIPQGSAKNLPLFTVADFQRPSAAIVSFVGLPVSNRTSSGNFIAIITITLNYFTGTSLFLHLSFCHTWVLLASSRIVGQDHDTAMP